MSIEKAREMKAVIIEDVRSMQGFPPDAPAYINHVIEKYEEILVACSEDTPLQFGMRGVEVKIALQRRGVILGTPFVSDCFQSR